MISATQNHTAATEMALRTLSMRRRSARSAGTAMPFASSRSLGRTSGRVGESGHHGGGHGVYITRISQMMQLRNTDPTGVDSPAPLTARSVLASALLGMDPPELPVAQLVRLTGLFGISENRARVALSRMVAAGRRRPTGPDGTAWPGHLAERQARQSASRAGSDRALRRRVVAGRGDHVRAARPRSAVPAGAPCAYARLAELREGVWMRPANLPVRLPERPGRRTSRS